MYEEMPLEERVESLKNELVILKRCLNEIIRKNQIKRVNFFDNEQQTITYPGAYALIAQRAFKEINNVREDS